MATSSTPKQNVYPNDTIYLQDGVVGYGDLDVAMLGKTDVGGNDLFYGGNADGEGIDGDNYAFGDAPELASSARGGADIFYGGNYAGGIFDGLGGIGEVGPGAVYLGLILAILGPQFLLEGMDSESSPTGNVFIGDAGLVRGTAKGGNDTMYGGINAANIFTGDAIVAAGSARGGSDTLIGGGAQSEQEVDPYYDQDNPGEGLTPGDPSEDTSGDVATLNLFYGDAALFGRLGEEELILENSVIGGADKLTGGTARAAWYDAAAINVLSGDGGYMGGHGTGGIDILRGGDAYGGQFYYQDDDNNQLDSYDEWYEGDAFSLNVLLGEGTMLGGYTQGGNDTITGGSAFTGSAGSQTDGESYHAVDTASFNLISGDALIIGENSHSGHDTLTGGNATGLTSNLPNGRTATGTLNIMAGDAFGMESGTGVWLGNDKLTGGNVTRSTDGQVLNFMSGDLGDLMNGFFFLDGSGMQIADSLAGATSYIRESFAKTGAGDTLGAMEGPGFGSGVITGSVVGGSDILVGGSGDGISTGSGLSFWGDIGDLPGTGEVDGSIINVMTGDAMGIADGGRGGFDTLTGGNSRETLSILVGDAFFIEDDGFAGKDTLISGSGVDIMVGDAFEDASIGAADRFVFRSNCNEDIILDYSYAEGDKIDLSALNTGRTNATDFKNFSTLMASNRITDVEGGICIDLDLNLSDSIDNNVVVLGISRAELLSDMFVM
jgi:hypothetical protein